MTKPKLILIAGPNGSGKSTMTEMLKKKGMDFGEYINPDEIALTLQGDDAVAITREAQRIAEGRRTELLNAGISHSFESVMSHPSKVDYLITAKEKGFYIVLLFVGINDPAVNVSRVADRVKKGGHDVPQHKIVERYKRTMDLLFSAVMASDEALIFDNTDDNLGLTQGAHIVNGKLKKFDPRFKWIRQYLVDKFEQHF